MIIIETYVVDFSLNVCNLIHYWRSLYLRFLFIFFLLKWFFLISKHIWSNLWYPLSNHNLYVYWNIPFFLQIVCTNFRFVFIAYIICIMVYAHFQFRTASMQDKHCDQIWPPFSPILLSTERCIDKLDRLIIKPESRI